MRHATVLVGLVFFGRDENILMLAVGSMRRFRHCPDILIFTLKVAESLICELAAT